MEKGGDGTIRRKPLSETRPEVVALARKLSGQLSLRAVAERLSAQGYLNERGKPYAAKPVASMFGKPGKTRRRAHSLAPSQ